MRFCFLCKWFGWYRWLCRGYNISWWSFTWDPRTFPALKWSTWWGPVTTIHNLCGFILDHYEHNFYHLGMLYVDDDARISSPRMLQFMVIGLKDPVRCWWKAAVTLHCLPTTSSRAKKEGVTRHWHLAAAASSPDRAGRMVGVHLWMNRCIFCCIWMLSWSKFHFDNRIGWDPGLAIRPCNHAV